ncbi:MAG: response regulator [Cellulosilyticaceae bacterium]
MALYKVLLVDDEEHIRMGIKRKIKWEELGFSVVGEAENGIEALDLMDKVMPDLVITDIRMSFMDGIKLAENIRDRFSTTKVIIMSGFDDFEYAQEAIKLGVMRYILKPINAMEMNVLLGEVKGLLDEEIASKSDIELLKKNYQKSLPLLKERFLNHWVEDYVNEEVIKENIEAFELALNEENLVVAVIRPDDLRKKDTDIHYVKNNSLLKVAILNICEEAITKHQLGIIFMKMDEIIVIIPLKEGEEPKESSRIFNILEQIRATVQKYLGTTVTIGVGSSCFDKTLLYRSYLSAIAALDYTVTIGNNKIICIDDIEPSYKEEIIFEEVDERELITAIKLGQVEQIKTVILKILDKLEGAQLALTDYQFYIVEVFSSIMHLIRSMGIENSSVFGGETNFFAMINKLATKEEIREWIFSVCVKTSKAILASRNSNKNELIEKAKKYIEAYYADCDLNAEKLCNHLHISTNYFSSLFKKETKLNFSSYLTRVRIEHAKTLLRNTDLKAFDIGNQVGYVEGHYFSYVFKKATGVAPTEYRHGKA